MLRALSCLEPSRASSLMLGVISCPLSYEGLYELSPLPSSAKGKEALEARVFSTKPTVYRHQQQKPHTRTPKQGGSHKRARNDNKDQTTAGSITKQTSLVYNCHSVVHRQQNGSGIIKSRGVVANASLPGKLRVSGELWRVCQ